MMTDYTRLRLLRGAVAGPWVARRRRQRWTGVVLWIIALAGLLAFVAGNP